MIKTPGEKNLQGFRLLDITVLDEVFPCLLARVFLKLVVYILKKMKTEEKELLLC